MQKPSTVRLGPRKSLSRTETIEQYVLLWMRVDEDRSAIKTPPVIRVFEDLAILDKVQLEYIPLAFR